MRVITGSARGRKLDTPKGSGTRPTAARVKEAIFSMLQFELEGARVIDLFAGSGQMGIEALSRGARFCAFVDADKESVDCIRRNLAHTRLGEHARIFAAEASAWLSGQKGPFDIAFLDPPYQKGVMEAVLPQVAALIAPGGAIICEAASNEALPEQAGDVPLYRAYRYGKTRITVYRRKAED